VVVHCAMQHRVRRGKGWTSKTCSRSCLCDKGSIHQTAVANTSSAADLKLPAATLPAPMPFVGSRH
jgi:hypothetical protein